MPECSQHALYDVGWPELTHAKKEGAIGLSVPDAHIAALPLPILGSRHSKQTVLKDGVYLPRSWVKRDQLRISGSALLQNHIRHIIAQGCGLVNEFVTSAGRFLLATVRGK